MHARSRAILLCSPPLVLAALYLAFNAFHATTASLVLPSLLPDPFGWLPYELLRWAFPAAALSLLRWWRQAGVLARTRWRSLPMPWVPVLSALLAFPGLQPVEPSVLLGTLLAALAVSVYEETVFRGLVLRAVLPWGPLPAVVLSSALFGLWHVGAMQPENWFVVAIGTLAGVGLAAMRLRSGTIWPAVLWHTGYNLPLYLGSTTGSDGLFGAPLVQIMAKLAPALVLFTYGLVLLRTRPR